jgi:hypothetical protein
MISHTKCEGVYSNVEVGKLIFNEYGGKTIVHNIIIFLKMFTLVSIHWIIIHHEEISLTYFYNYHKITNENIPSFSKFYQNIDYLQQW